MVLGMLQGRVNPAACIARRNPGPVHRSCRGGRLKARVAISAADANGEGNGVQSPNLQPSKFPTEAGTPAPATKDAQPSLCLANLLVSCPDQKGVIAAISQLLYGFNCNIISSDQFTDTSTNMFFQRITYDYTDIIVGQGNRMVLERALGELALRYGMTWSVAYKDVRKRVALLVSKQDHCLYDLLIRHKAGELSADIPLIISNHPDLRHIADMFNVPFRVLPLKKEAGAKEAQEAQIEEALATHSIDLVVLARYMQIFSPEFCERHWKHTINIHHSFLPAFEGARPYHRAHERGVKIIGATAHYATSELDAGPIVDQAVTRITHRDSVEDMIRKGKDLERMVLARAVRWVLDDRVMVHNNKTVVFED